MAILRGRRSLNPQDPALAYLATWGEPNVFASGCGTNELGGLGWGVEGIVRMNAGFEMICCNFSSPSIRLLRHLNVAAPLLPESLLSNEQVIGIDQQRLARRVPDLKDGSPPSHPHTMLPLPSSTTKKAHLHPSLVRPTDWREWAPELFI